MSDRTKKIILWSACGVVGFALVIMLLLIFLLPGIRPQAQSSSAVSYTHLDVYKRQVYVHHSFLIKRF